MKTSKKFGPFETAKKCSDSRYSSYTTVTLVEQSVYELS